MSLPSQRRGRFAAAARLAHVLLFFTARCAPACFCQPSEEDSAQQQNFCKLAKKLPDSSKVPEIVDNECALFKLAASIRINDTYLALRDAESDSALCDTIENRVRFMFDCADIGLTIIRSQGQTTLINQIDGKFWLDDNPIFFNIDALEFAETPNNLHYKCNQTQTLQVPNTPDSIKNVTLVLYSLEFEAFRPETKTTSISQDEEVSFFTQAQECVPSWKLSVVRIAFLGVFCVAVCGAIAVPGVVFVVQKRREQIERAAEVN